MQCLGTEDGLVSVGMFAVLVATEASAVFPLKIVLHVDNTAVQHVRT